jgi:hypothetical protein
MISKQELRDEIERLNMHLEMATISQEALAEIKAIVDGESPQAVRDVVYGAIQEIADYPAGFSTRFERTYTSVEPASTECVAYIAKSGRLICDKCEVATEIGMRLPICKETGELMSMKNLQTSFIEGAATSVCEGEAGMTCEKCNGTGWFMYDHNHSTGCPDCCEHPQGQRYLQSESHPNPGTYTCGHCGTELPTSVCKKGEES